MRICIISQIESTEAHEYGWGGSWNWTAGKVAVVVVGITLADVDGWKLKLECGASFGNEKKLASVEYVKQNPVVQKRNYYHRSCVNR